MIEVCDKKSVISTGSHACALLQKKVSSESTKWRSFFWRPSLHKHTEQTRGKYYIYEHFTFNFQNEFEMPGIIFFQCYRGDQNPLSNPPFSYVKVRSLFVTFSLISGLFLQYESRLPTPRSPPPLIFRGHMLMKLKHPGSARLRHTLGTSRETRGKCDVREKVWIWMMHFVN